MSAQFSLEIQRTPVQGAMLCPLCDKLFEPRETAAMLYNGATPLGFLCEHCLMVGPHVAASGVRHRAVELHSLAEEAPARLGPKSWPDLSQAIEERVVHWNLLADQLDRLAWWPLKRVESA